MLSRMPNEHESRCLAVARLLAEEGADFLLATPSTDLYYLSGYGGEPSERLIALLLPAAGQPLLITPQFEAARLVATVPFARLLAWGETDDPIALLTEAVKASVKARPRLLGGQQTWAGTLLALRSALPEADYGSAQPVLAALRLVKSPAEVDLLRAAGGMCDRAFGRLLQQPLAGRSEREVAELLAGEMRRAGLETLSFLIVASGPNAALPHHEPGERRLTAGDAVVLDFGGTYRRYQSDITRTIVVGAPTEELKRVHEQVRQAQEIGYRSVRPGLPAAEVDAATRQHLVAAGLGEFFIHRTGHGLGLDVHEEPYLVAGNRAPLRPGMVFSVEPGAYLPGQFGVRVEDTVVVTETGAERLNQAPRELLVVG